MARDEGTRAVLVTESEPVKVEASRPRLRTGRRLIGDGLVEIPIRRDVEPAQCGPHQSGSGRIETGMHQLWAAGRAGR